MSSVQCAKCLKDFDWKDSYHSRNTPGAHLHKSPGQGDWWPRAFCPHCGFLVAEWDIDHSQDRNRWKWHGANAKLNTGKELPPSPLAWWGMEEIPDDALVTVQEDHIDIKRVRRLFGHGPTEEVEEIAVTAEELLGNPCPTCKHTLTGEGKKATEQIIEIEADSLEEAREQMKSLTPEGFHLLSEQIIWDGKPQTVQISADTIVAAFAKAETLIPVGAEILEKKELSAPEQKVIRVEAEDEDGIEMSAKRTYQIRGAKFKNIRLITPGSKGLLGLGKKANLYEVEVHRTAVVSISYRTKAKISVKIGEKVEKTAQAESEKGSSTSRKVAYLLIIGQGPKPADELRYVQQVVRSLVPEALASSSARISTRWQTGPVDQYYIIGAAYASFGPLDTDKYDLETQDFFDAVGGKGVILKVFHKEPFAGRNETSITQPISQRMRVRENWLQFAPQLVVPLIDKPFSQPQLYLHCHNLAMAETLITHLSEASAAFLTAPAELIEFPDGSGAVKFLVQDGSSIPNLIISLFATRYGDENLLVDHGIAVGVPQSDKQRILRHFNQPQGVDAGGTLMW